MRMSSLKAFRFSWSLVCLLSLLLAAITVVRAERLPIKTYTIADGLASDRVVRIRRDSKGFLWFCTSEGLSRFDGYRFTNYGIDQGLPSRIVYDLLETRGGIYWVATSRGLCMFNPDAATQPGTASQQKFTFDYQGQETRGHEITTVVEDRAGVIWCGGRNSLYRLDQSQGRWICSHVELGHAGAGPKSNFEVRSFLEDRRGALWINVSNGLYRMSPGGCIERFGTPEGLPTEKLSSTMLEDQTGRVWIGAGHGLYQLVSEPRVNAPAVARVYTTQDGLEGNFIRSLFQAADGKLWVGTGSGLSVSLTDAGQGGLRFRSYTKAHGLIGAGVTSMDEDRDDNLWLGTENGGVMKYEQDGFTTYDETDGLSAFRINTLLINQAGDLCAIGSSDNRRFIQRFDGRRFEAVELQRRTATFHRFTARDGIPQDSAPTAFGEDATGNLWIGFYHGGLARYAGGRLVMFTVADGLPAGLIRGIYLDHASRLWVATGEGGVARIDDPTAERPRFIIYNTANGLSSNQVTAITEDRWGRIYIGTGRGLNCLDPASGHIRQYTKADGLASNFINVALRDREGALWFGTLEGLSRLIPQSDRPASQPPVLISSLRIGGAPHPISELGVAEVTGLEVGASQKRVSIDFFGLGLAAGEALHYQHKLEGADSDWSSPSDHRTVNYTNLAAGRYRFLVRAVSADGTISPAPAVVAFKVLSPIWHRWWFFSLASLSACLLGYVLYRYRVAQLITLERVRTRIATDLHDDIGASLSRVAILSEVVKHQTGSLNLQTHQTLTVIADSARGLVDSMSDIVWSVDPRRDDLKNVVLRIRQFAADVLESQDIRWDFTLPSEPERIKLTPEQRRHIFLIFKEALNNIARHARCANVALSVSVTRRRLLAEIRDDGHGLAGNPPGELAGEPGANGYGGNGLRNMQARAAELGGTLEIASTPGQGTRLILTIPLRR